MTTTTRKHTTVLGFCIVLLGVLGWVDYLTGYELGFYLFYSMPVGLAAWQVGRRAGLVVALLASATWWFADRLAGDKYSSAFIGYWNTAMHFGTFIINAVAIAKVKSTLDQRHQLADELAEARRHAGELAALLPLCTGCRQPQPADALRGKVQAYLDSAPRTATAGAVCERCGTAELKPSAA